MKRWGSGGIPPPLFTLALDGSEWSASSPGQYTSRERAPSNQWIGRWVDPRAGLDAGNRTRAVQPVARRYTD
jgi:hypothetical protein